MSIIINKTWLMTSTSRSLMESRLRDGTTLIVDRYSYSGVAFSAAKGLDVEWCKVNGPSLVPCAFTAC